MIAGSVEVVEVAHNSALPLAFVICIPPGSLLQVQLITLRSAGRRALPVHVLLLALLPFCTVSSEAFYFKTKI